MEYLLLNLLREPLSLKELEVFTGYERVTLNTALYRMLKKGLIKRTGSRRSYVYSLTEKGLIKLMHYNLQHMLRRYNNVSRS